MRELHELRQALQVIAEVMRKGEATHQPGDWLTHDPDHHLDRAVRHLTLLRTGDQSEPHLSHACCRLLMSLALEMRDAGASAPSFDENLELPWFAPLQELENAYIHKVLRQVGGDKVKAARILGIHLSTLYRKLERLPHVEACPPSPALEPPAVTVNWADDEFFAVSLAGALL